MGKEKLTKEEKLEKKRLKKENGVGVGKLLIWQSSAVSKTITVLIMMYLMVYCTDTLGLPATAVSTMLLLSKILDGVTDAFAGFLVDKTQTKLGKARPYEVFIVGLWLCTWLMFSCPEGFQTAAKLAWVFVMYVLTNAICTTFLNANATPYVVRAFKGPQIVKLTSYGSFVTMGVSIAFNMLFPTAVATVATSAAGWSRLVGTLAIPCAAIGLLRMIFIPEKYDVDTTAESSQEKVTYKEAVKVFKGNHYLMILALMTLVFNVVANMGITQYYFTRIVGNIALMGVTSIATIVTLPLALIFPSLISKFSTVKLMRFGFLVSALGYLLNFFAGSNIVLLMIGSVLTGAGTVPASMLISLAVLECADFNEWQGNRRMEGTMSSLIGLSGKIGAALGTFLLGVLLDASGYVGTAETITASATTMIRMLYSLIPMALYFLTFLTLFGYNKLDEMMPKIKEENEARREAAKAKNNG